MTRIRFLTALAAAAALALPSAAAAQDQPIEIVGGGVKTATSIMIPALNGNAVGTNGRAVADVIAADLRSTGAFQPIGPLGVPTYDEAEAQSPSYPQWRNLGAAMLVTGAIQDTADGRVSVSCILSDVTAGRRLESERHVVAPDQWRRAAHRCADMVYARLTGQAPYLDSRIVYVAETGTKTNRTKRLAIMDADGTNHRYLSINRDTVVTPRFSPDGKRLVYTAYIAHKPRVLLMDVDSGFERLLIPGDHITFAPRFSPDGRHVVFTKAEGGNSDIYIVPTAGGAQTRLTNMPGADTSPSFSPDGRYIVFESDRSGSQQLYVMNADGSNQRRISFGGGRYGSPVWSPSGDLIAFSRLSPGFAVGVMRPDGKGLRMLSKGWQDEMPSFAPNGRFVMFHRTEQGSGDATLYYVPVAGGTPRRMPTPVGGSDPAWSPASR